MIAIPPVPPPGVFAFFGLQLSYGMCYGRGMETATAPIGFDQTTYICQARFTHHNPNCTAAKGTVTECTWETRGDIACFSCFELPALNLPHMGDNLPTLPNGNGGSATARQPVDTTPINPAKVEAWLAGLDRKLTREDMTPRKVRAARQWLDAYTGTFEFLVDVKAQRTLSFGAAAAVLNCWRAEVLRNQPRTTQATTSQAPQAPAQATTIDLTSVPSGLYMTEAGHRYRVDNLVGDDKAGKWAEWVFVKQGSEYGNQAKLGNQRPGGTYRGAAEDAIAEIAANPMAAMARYGQNTGTCGACSRTLEDPVSVAAGIGPVCRQKF